MPTARLTKTMIESAQPATRDTYLWDSQLSGFGVKVTPSGSRIYLVQYRAKGSLQVRRYNLGRHGAPHTTETARVAASGLLARIRLGEDPFQTDRDRRAEEGKQDDLRKEAAAKSEKERFELVVAEFIERYAKPKNRRWDEAERVLTSSDVAAWKAKAISEITPRDVLAAIDEATARSPPAARLLFAHLRKLFGWCVERMYLSASPCAGLRAPAPSRARDRVLSDAELALVWRACGALGEPFGPLIRLLILTGQRREEVAGMRWFEIDLDGREWVIPANRAKNGQAHSVDLDDAALLILQDVAANQMPFTRLDSVAALGRTTHQADSFVFTTNGRTCVSGHSKAKAQLDAHIATLLTDPEIRVASKLKAVGAWRVHDLRRTAATGMARLGYAPHIVEAVLNHRSGARGGLVAVYQHYDHRTERRSALLAWSSHVARLVHPDPNPLSALSALKRRS